MFKLNRIPHFTVFVLLFVLSRITATAQFAFDRYQDTIYSTKNNITYLGPGFNSDQIIVIEGEQVKLFSINAKKILREVKVPYLSVVHDVIRADSARQEILINPNHSLKYDQDFGMRSLGMVKVSFSEKKMLGFLRPDAFFSSSGYHPKRGVFVLHEWVTLDSLNFWVHSSTVINYTDTVQKTFRKSYIGSYAISKDLNILAAGFEDGKLVIMDAKSLNFLHTDSSHNESITNIVFAENKIIFSGAGGMLSILELITFTRKDYPLRDRYYCNFTVSKNNNVLLFDHENKSDTFIHLNNDNSLGSHNIVSPVIRSNSISFDGDIWYIAENLSDDKHRIVAYSIKRHKNSEVIFNKKVKVYNQIVQKENQLIDQPFFSPNDTLKREIMVNQLSHPLTLKYLDEIYTDSQKLYGLITDDQNAYLYHLASGRLVKRFHFPHEINKACISSNGRYLGFYSEYRNSHMDEISRILVYDVKKRLTYEFPMQQYRQDFANHISELSFTENNQYITFNTQDRYTNNPFNAVQISSGVVSLISDTLKDSTYIITVKEFEQTAAAKASTEKGLRQNDFIINQNLLTLSSFSGGDISLELKTLHRASVYHKTFCGSEIYNNSTDNNLWKELGLKLGEWDWSYDIYRPIELNDSLFAFISGKYNNTFYIANAKTRKIIYKNSGKDISYFNVLSSINDKQLIISFTENYLRKNENEILLILDTDKLNHKSFNLNQIKSDFLNNEGLTKKEQQFQFVNIRGILPDQRFVISDYTALTTADIKGKNTGRKHELGSVVKTVITNSSSGISYIGTESGKIYCYDYKTDSVWNWIIVKPGIAKMQIRGTDIFVISDNSIFTIIDITKNRIKCEIHSYNSQDGYPSFSVFTPELYYYSEKSGSTELYLCAEDFRIYDINQYDIQFNRPDKVLESMGYADTETIKVYAEAYKKRLRKLGINETSSDFNVGLPELQVSESVLHLSNTRDSLIIIPVKVSDSLNYPARIQVLINRVPVFGAQGYPIADRKVHTAEFSLPLELITGLNEISLSVVNDIGIESYKTNLRVHYQPVDSSIKKPDLYLITIGAGSYLDTAYNLKYAEKDASDIDSFFASQKQLFRNIYRKQLLNKEVNRDSMAALKQFLSTGRRQDVVVITFAGHGLLSDSFDYYLAAYDMDFSLPQNRGISYASLESVLDGIKHLQKVMFIDACHSGEVDKEELVMNKTASNARPTGRGTNIQIKNNHSGMNYSKLASELFADLRQGTGTTVVSASGGMELAMESAEWNNGLFTYCLLKGLKEKKADRNRDGEVWLTELQEYLQAEVAELSGGMQKPTSRIQNLSVDFRLN